MKIVMGDLRRVAVQVRGCISSTGVVDCAKLLETWQPIFLSHIHKCLALPSKNCLLDSRL